MARFAVTPERFVRSLGYMRPSHDVLTVMSVSSILSRAIGSSRLRVAAKSEPLELGTARLRSPVLRMVRTGERVCFSASFVAKGRDPAGFGDQGVARLGASR